MLRSIAYTVAGVLIVGSAAQAQFLPRPGASSGGTGSPGASPTAGGIGSAPSAGGFSPYLNLTRGGNSAAVNYYGIVRPQMSFQNSIQALQQQQGSGNSIEADDPTMPFMVVGTRARFLNTSGYFLNLGGSTRSAGPGTGSGVGSGATGQGQAGSTSGGGFSTAASSGSGVFLGGAGGQSGVRSGNRGGRK